MKYQRRFSEKKKQQIMKLSFTELAQIVVSWFKKFSFMS